MIVLGPVSIRYLETALLGALLVSSGLLFVRRRPAGLVWWSALSVVLLAVHLYMEETRWQMVPAGALIVAFGFILSTPSRRAYRSAGLVVRFGLLVLLVVPAVILPFAVPLFVVPTPTGPNRVGTASVAFSAPDGPEQARVWYPAARAGQIAATDALAAPYWSVDDYRAHTVPGTPRLMASHLLLVPTPAHLRAPAVDRVMPVVIVRGDRNNLPGDFVHVFTEAASWGWFVVEAPYGASDDRLIDMIGALAADTVDTAFDRRVDASRVVLLSLGPVNESLLGLAEILIAGRYPLEAIIPNERFAVEYPGASIPAPALTLRHRMVFPSGLLVGGSDVSPARLEGVTLAFVSALLRHAEGDVPPVLSGRRPPADALLNSDATAVLTLLPEPPRR